MSEKLSNNIESNTTQSSPWDTLGDVKPSSVTKAETDKQLVEATEDNHIEISFDNINSKLEGSALQLPPDEYTEFDTKELFNQVSSDDITLGDVKPSSVTKAETNGQPVEATEDNHIEISFDDINSRLKGPVLQLPPDEYDEFDTKELFDRAFEQDSRIIKPPEELESSFIEAPDDNHIEFPDRYSTVIDHNGNLVVHSKKED